MERGIFNETTSELKLQLTGLIDNLSSLVDSLNTVSAETLPDVDGTDEQSLLKRALWLLLESHEVGRASIYLLHDGQLECKAGLDHMELAGPGAASWSAETIGRPVPVGEGIMGLAAQTGKLQHCRDCSTDPRYKILADGATAQGSLISAPLVNGEGPYGVLNVSHPEPAYFTIWHERLISIYSSVIAQLIHNERQLRGTVGEIQRLTSQLRSALTRADDLGRRQQELSFVDDLTGLHNGRFFFPEARAAVDRVIRYHGDCALIAFHVDRFADLNAQHGRAAGDRVLAATARLISGYIRRVDILARTPGAHFVLLLPQTALHGARLLAERICKAAESELIEVERSSITLTMSAGVSACTTFAGENPNKVLNRLIREAEEALYKTSNEGRDNSVLSYSPP